MLLIKETNIEQNVQDWGPIFQSSQAKYYCLINYTYQCGFPFRYLAIFQTQ